MTIFPTIISRIPTNTDLNPLEYILSQCGVKLEDIYCLYRGGDRVCRCGCAGRYHEKGSRGFSLSMNLLKHIPAEELHNIEAEMKYINIPLDDNGPHGHCICLYIE